MRWTKFWRATAAGSSGPAWEAGVAMADSRAVSVYTIHPVNRTDIEKLLAVSKVRD
jgi:hypothetical protein